MENFENPYKVLNLSNNASAEEIKKQFRKMSLKYHPDRSPDDNGEMFKKIQAAYEILGDDEKRNEYNKLKQMGIPFDPQNLHGGGMFDPSMLFEMLFSKHPGVGPDADLWGDFNSFTEMAPGVHIFHGHNKPRSSMIPPPISINLSISLQEAFEGGTMNVEIERWVKNGDKQIQEIENLYFKLHEGVDDNEIITIKERGHSLNNVHGNVQIHININKHDLFERDGMNLIYHKTINLKESLCGFSFDLKYLNNKVYKINNQPGNIIPHMYEKVIAGLGMQRDDTKGNLIIKFSVEYPEKLTSEQLTALNKVL